MTTTTEPDLNLVTCEGTRTPYWKLCGTLQIEGPLNQIQGPSKSRDHPNSGTMTSGPSKSGEHSNRGTTEIKGPRKSRDHSNRGNTKIEGKPKSREQSGNTQNEGTSKSGKHPNRGTTQGKEPRKRRDRCSERLGLGTAVPRFACSLNGGPATWMVPRFPRPAGAGHSGDGNRSNFIPTGLKSCFSGLPKEFQY